MWQQQHKSQDFILNMTNIEKNCSIHAHPIPHWVKNCYFKCFWLQMKIVFAKLRPIRVPRYLRFFLSLFILAFLIIIWQIEGSVLLIILSLLCRFLDIDLLKGFCYKNFCRLIYWTVNVMSLLKNFSPSNNIKGW